MPSRKPRSITNETGFVDSIDFGDLKKTLDELGDPGSETAWCSVCKTRKPASEFYKSSSRSQGVQSTCKSCKRGGVNREPFEEDGSLVPVLVSAVTDILAAGDVEPHRNAIRRHLSNRALDAAIAKLQSIRREA